MPQTLKKDPIIDYITSCFPGEKEPKKVFESKVESLTRDHDIFLDACISWLDGLVKKHKNNNKNGHKERFICRLDTSNKKKSWYSIAEKLWRDSQTEDSKYNLDNFNVTMKDLIRLRIVCNFLSDIEGFKTILIEDYNNDELKQQAFTIENISDTIKQHPSDRKSGHRSVKYLLSSTEFQGVSLELQIMTLFQEAWDQKDHYLIYERRRMNPDNDNENFPEFEDELVHDMGGSLYVLDTLFNEIKLKLEKSSHENP